MALFNPLYNQPKIQYTAITAGGKSVTLGSAVPIKVSFVPGYNTVSITLRSTNVSLSKFKIMITPASETNWGVDVGTQACYYTGIPANTSTTVSFNVTPSTFSYGNTSYRLLLCAQNSIDYSWDLSELFVGSDSAKFIPKNNSDGLETVVRTTS